MPAFPETLIHPSKRTLKRDGTRWLAKLDASISRNELNKALKGKPFGTVEDVDGKDLRHRIGQLPDRWFLKRRGTSGGELDKSKLATMLGRGVLWVAPVYRMDGVDGPEALMCPKPDVLVVGGRGAEAGFTAVVRKAADALGFELDEKLAKHVRSFARYVARDPAKTPAHEALPALQKRLGERAIVQLAFAPYVDATCAPDPLLEPLYPQQAAHQHMASEIAWDDASGNKLGDPSVYVCIVDRHGFDLNHPDLVRATNQGFDMASFTAGTGVVAPTASATNNAHGTAMAGVVAGNWDTVGQVGVAPRVSIFGVKAESDDSDVYAAAVTKAATEPNFPGEAARRRVIVLSGTGNWAWAGTVSFTAALNDCRNTDSVIVAPAGHTLNGAAGSPAAFPAGQPDVISVGASTLAAVAANDQRAASVNVTLAVTGGVINSDTWESRFGPNLTLLAPGVGVVTDDVVGNDGYNVTATGAADLADRSYTRRFEGTSCAAAHVAGLAALIRSRQPLATATDVRAILAASCEKTGGYAYAGAPPTRHDEAGYGRIRVDNAVRATVEQADVFISDGTGDVGAEPSGVGAFWAMSDLVVLTTQQTLTDAQFTTELANSTNNQVPRNVDSWAYVRVRNLSLVPAYDVQVRLAFAAPSTGFMFPRDWVAVEILTDIIVPQPDPVVTTDSAVNTYYVRPRLGPGEVFVARFRVTAAQATVPFTNSWPHPCALAHVKAGNDKAFNDYLASVNGMAIPGIQPQKNNVIQRNLMSVASRSPWDFAFFLGADPDSDEPFELHVQMSGYGRPLAMRFTIGDLEKAFPALAAAGVALDAVGVDEGLCAGSFELLNDARVRARLGAFDGELLVKAGTRWHARGHARTEVEGGQVVQAEGEKTIVDVKSARAKIRVPRPRGRTRSPVHLSIDKPAGFPAGTVPIVDLFQRDRRGIVIGGIRLRLV